MKLVDSETVAGHTVSVERDGGTFYVLVAVNNKPPQRLYTGSQAGARTFFAGVIAGLTLMG